MREVILNIKGIDYIVSDDGRIFSTKNNGRGEYHKEITQRKDSCGYFCITVGKSNNRTRMRVHRIVALAFIKNVNNLPEVDHIDNNKENNNASNLQWCTGFYNKSKIPFDRRSKSHKHELNGRSILKKEEVIKIRQLYETDGVSIASIAREYNCGWSTISSIVKYKSWKDI